jgi:hypothetical protein
MLLYHILDSLLVTWKYVNNYRSKRNFEMNSLQTSLWDHFRCLLRLTLHASDSPTKHFINLVTALVNTNTGVSSARLIPIVGV